VLVPSSLKFDFLGMMQPRMNFHAGHCNFECTICMNVCPRGAMLPLTVEKKKLTQLGVAKFIKENCVVYTDNTDCGACSEQCPTKAVDMVPYPNPANKRLSRAPQNKLPIIPRRHSRVLLAGIQKKSLDARLRGMTVGIGHPLMQRCT
jgi:Pyruvate/2-oxoacid:ferredoxin oxidoreductase delta subunit